MQEDTKIEKIPTEDAKLDDTIVKDTKKTKKPRGRPKRKYNTYPKKGI